MKKEHPEGLTGRNFKGTFIPLILKTIIIIKNKIRYLKVQGHSSEKKVVSKH